MVCNDEMKQLLKQINLEDININTEYEVTKKFVGDIELYVWQTRDKKYTANYGMINKMPNFYKSEKNFISNVRFYTEHYEWYINELTVAGENKLEMLKKALEIYKGLKVEMQEKFPNTTFDIWLSIQYSDELDKEIVVIRFNQVIYWQYIIQNILWILL